MKNLFAYALILSVLLLGLLASLGVRAEEAKGDTYNFYFQKAPGPVTVNQGVTTTVPPSPNAPPVAPTVTIATAPPAETPASHRFYLTLGYAMANFNKMPTRYEKVSGQKSDYLNVTGQYAVKGEYDLTERLSLTGELYALNRPVANSTAYETGRSERDGVVMYGLPERERRAGDAHALDFAVGTAFHLVHLRATTLSLLGGLTTTPVRHFEYLSGGPTTGGVIAERGIDHEKKLFAGARLRLLADNVWGLDLSYRTYVGGGAGLTQLGLTFAL